MKLKKMYYKKLDKTLKQFGGYKYFRDNDRRFDELSLGLNTNDGGYNSFLDISYWYDYKNKYDGSFTLNGIKVSLTTIESLITDWRWHKLLLKGVVKNDLSKVQKRQ